MSGGFAFSDLLALSEKTKSLDLKDRVLREDDIALLARALTSRTHNLISLNLSNVKINAEDAMVLAKALEFNVTLQKLSFEHNPLGYVGVSALAEAVKLNTSLQEFSLADTLLQAQSAALIASALYTNGTLTSLHMESNRIGSDGAQHLAEALLVNQSIKILDLEGNNIGDTGAAYIATALTGNTSLISLNLRHNGITSKGAGSLGEALKSNKSLHQISLSKLDLSLQMFRGEKTKGKREKVMLMSNTQMSADVDYPVVMPLLSQNQFLSKLILSNMGLCGIGPDGRGKRVFSGVSCLVKALEFGLFKDKLEELNLSQNFIDDYSAKQLSEGIKQLGALSILNLSHNDIRGPGLKALAMAIKLPLMELQLNSNPNLGPICGEIIGSLLVDSNRGGNISVLNLGNCGLGSEGVIQIANGVGSSSSLEVLILEQNNVGKEGKLALGSALYSSKSSKLKSFSMCDTWSVVPGQKLLNPKPPKNSSELCNEEIILMAGIIVPNRWLRSIVLDGWPIGSDGISYLCAAIKRNCHLDSISLQNCNLDIVCGKMLLEFIIDKPGIQISCEKGNCFGEEIANKIIIQTSSNKEILTDNWASNLVKLGVKVHLLGEAGVGKTTLRKAIQRTYWESFFKKTDLEKAPDTGIKPLSERTRGVCIDKWAYQEAEFSLWDHGGLPCFQSMMSQNMLSSPHCVFAVFVSLSLTRAQQRAELRRWLQILQVCMYSPESTALIIIGSRADHIGELGQDYLNKLWEGVKSEFNSKLQVEDILPKCVGCVALDCRKGHAKNMDLLRKYLLEARDYFIRDAAVHFPRITSYAIDTLQQVISKKSEKCPFYAIRFADFWAKLRKNVFPRLTEEKFVLILNAMHSVGVIFFTQHSPNKSWILARYVPFFSSFLGELLIKVEQGVKSGGLPILDTTDISQLAETYNVHNDLNCLYEVLQDMEILAEIRAVPLGTRQFILPGGICLTQLPETHYYEKTCKEIARIVELEHWNVCGNRILFSGFSLIPGFFSRVEVVISVRYTGAVVVDSFQLLAALEGMQVLVQWVRVRDEEDAIDIIVCGKNASAVTSEVAELARCINETASHYSRLASSHYEIEEGSIKTAISPNNRATTIQKSIPTASAYVQANIWDGDAMSVDSFDSVSMSGRSVSTTNPFSNSKHLNPFEGSLSAPKDMKSLSSNPFANVNMLPNPAVTILASEKLDISTEILRIDEGGENMEKNNQDALENTLTHAEFQILPEIPENDSVFIGDGNAEIQIDLKSVDVRDTCLTKFDDEILSKVDVMFRPSMSLQIFEFEEQHFEILLLRPGGITIEPFDIDSSSNLVKNKNTMNLNSNIPYKVAKVVDITDDRITSNFSYLGNEIPFTIKNSVVIGVGRVPWGTYDTKYPGYDAIAKSLDPSCTDTVYPLFVQLVAAPPRALGEDGPSTPKNSSKTLVKKQLGNITPLQRVYQVIVGTNRKRTREQSGDFMYGAELSSEPELDWGLATVCCSSTLPELGGDTMFVDTYDYTMIGMYYLTPSQAFSLMEDHPCQQVLVYVHGFNNNLTHAVRSTALFGRALHNPLTVLLSWPSDPQQTGRGWLIEKVMSAYERSYTKCEHNMHASVRPFVQTALELGRLRKKLTWSAHSMGCYLLLNLIDRLQYETANSAALFSRVILSAPDVPTWFFTSTVIGAVNKGVQVCHYYNPDDQATEASRARRASEGPTPGNAAVVVAEGLQTIDCGGAKSAVIGANMSLNHDYGRSDGYCLLDQREFLAGEPPAQRCLEEIKGGMGGGCTKWKLRTTAAPVTKNKK